MVGPLRTPTRRYRWRKTRNRPSTEAVAAHSMAADSRRTRRSASWQLSATREHPSRRQPGACGERDEGGGDRAGLWVVIWDAQAVRFAAGPGP